MKGFHEKLGRGEKTKGVALSCLSVEVLGTVPELGGRAQQHQDGDKAATTQGNAMILRTQASNLKLEASTHCPEFYAEARRFVGVSSWALVSASVPREAETKPLWLL